MSYLTTSATRRSRMVPAAVLIASAAASSHDVPLVPMTSVTRYTLMTLSFAWPAGPGAATLSWPASGSPRPGPGPARSARRSPPDLSLAPGPGGVQDRCPADDGGHRTRRPARRQALLKRDTTIDRISRDPRPPTSARRVESSAAGV